MRCGRGGVCRETSPAPVGPRPGPLGQGWSLTTGRGGLAQDNLTGTMPVTLKVDALQSESDKHFWQSILAARYLLNLDILHWHAAWLMARTATSNVIFNA